MDILDIIQSPPQSSLEATKPLAGYMHKLLASVFYSHQSNENSELVENILRATLEGFIKTSKRCISSQ